MSNQKVKIKSLVTKANSIVDKLRPYSFLAFLIFVVIIYGFVLLRINNLGHAEPSAEAVSNQVKAAQIPHIDQSVVKQLESLQDNSVSVQTLFDEARSNPFQ